VIPAERTLRAKLAAGAEDYKKAARTVSRPGAPLTLTPREYALLEYFLRNPGRVLTRPMLAEHVWGLDFDPESNIVDVYVGYLRRKIDGEGDRRLLHTLRGAGYKLSAEE
jgi:DNA-binding response OmpR family regulator